MSVDELIRMVGLAVGRDKMIDRHIAKAIGWHRVEPRHARTKAGAWIAPEDWIGEMSNGAPILDSLRGTTMHRDVPDFTSSMDAAATLIPEGLYWLAGYGRTKEAEPLGGAQIYRPGDFDTPVAEGEGRTAAIAICIASLRARRNGGE